MFRSTNKKACSLTLHAPFVRRAYALCEPCMAGEVGIEPTNAGIKIRCLTTWRLPKFDRCASISKSVKRVLIHAIGNKTFYRYMLTTNASQRRFRPNPLAKRHENAGARTRHTRIPVRL